MVHKRHVDDALGAYILLQVQDHNDKAKDVAEEVGVSLATIKVSKALKGKLSRCSLVKATTKV